MIAPIPGWTWEVRGGGVSLVPPEGRAAGGVRYRERVRPLKRVTAVIDELRRRDDRFKVTAMSHPEPLVTEEGEHAALVVIDGTMDGRPAQRAMGFVFGDDFYAHVAGLALEPDQFARFADVVRRLVTGDRHFLGVRRRRYVYSPPRGWQGRLITHFHAHWYPLDFPANASTLIVCPALPRAEGGSLDDALGALAHQATLAFRPDEIIGPEGVSAAGLEGRAWALPGRYADGFFVVRDLVVLADDVYLYPIAIDSPTDRREANRIVLDAVAHSVRPIPRPGAPTSRSDALRHWS